MQLITLCIFYPKITKKYTAHNFTSLQNVFIKKFEATKGLTKSVKRTFEDFENAIMSLSDTRVLNSNESSS